MQTWCVFTDLPGRKMRTGGIYAQQGKVLKCRPLRDAFGFVLRPATLSLVPPTSWCHLASQSSDEEGTPQVRITQQFFDALSEQTVIGLKDTRGKVKRQTPQ